MYVSDSEKAKGIDVSRQRDGRFNLYLHNRFVAQFDSLHDAIRYAHGKIEGDKAKGDKPLA